MYTKEYFRQQLSDIISPIEKYYNGGKVQYARHSAWYENLSADVEAFARPLWGLVPFWAGGGENETFEKCSHLEICVDDVIFYSLIDTTMTTRDVRRPT